MTPITVDRDVFTSKIPLKGIANVVGDALVINTWWPRTLLPYPYCHTDKETTIPFDRIDGVRLKGNRITFGWIQDGGNIQNVSFVADTAANAAQLATLLPSESSLAAQQVLAEHAMFTAHLAATTQFTWATPLFVAINVAVYLVMGLCGVDWFHPKPDVMIPWGANWWPLTTGGEWWRLITSAFLHFGLLHIAFNMWALWAVGRFAERLFGPSIFAFIYLAAAIFSGLVSVWWSNHNVVIAGASGAVFAVYGALLAYLICQRASFPTGALDSLKRSSFAFMFYNLVFGMLTPGISNSAHLGGIAAGFVLGFVMARPLNPETRLQRAWPQAFAGVFLATVSILGGVAIIPKNPANISAQNAFLAAWKTIESEEMRVDTLVKSLLKQANANELSNADLAQRLDNEVIVVFQGIAQRLSNNLPGAGPFQHVAELLGQYYDARLNAYQTLSLACRTEDRTKTVEYNRLIKLGDALLLTIQREVKDLEK